MNKDNLKEYADLKIQANQIADRLDELKPEILKDILDADLDKVPTTLGSFTIKKRKEWKYSSAVVLLKEQLEEQKKVEEADGTATFNEVPTLEFRENKK